MATEPGPGHLSDEDLQSYLDRELGATEADWAAAHLRTCAACRERASGVEAVFHALSELSEVRLSRDLAPAVMKRLGPASRPWPWLLGAQGIAALALAVWLGGSAAADWNNFIAARLQAPPSWLLEILAWSRVAGEALWQEGQAWVGFAAEALHRIPELSGSASVFTSPALLPGLLVFWLALNGLLLVPGVRRAVRSF